MNEILINALVSWDECNELELNNDEINYFFRRPADTHGGLKKSWQKFSGVGNPDRIVHKMEMEIRKQRQRDEREKALIWLEGLSTKRLLSILRCEGNNSWWHGWKHQWKWETFYPADVKEILKKRPHVCTDKNLSSKERNELKKASKKDRKGRRSYSCRR